MTTDYNDYQRRVLIESSLELATRVAPLNLTLTLARLADFAESDDAATKASALDKCGEVFGQGQLVWCT